MPITIGGESCEVVSYLTEHQRQLVHDSLIEATVMIPRAISAANQTVIIPEHPYTEVFTRLSILRFDDLNREAFTTGVQKY